MVKQANKDYFTFKLANSIKAHGKDLAGNNEFVEYKELYLKAPTFRDKEKTRELKKYFISAIISMTQSMSRDEAEQSISSNSEDAPFDVKAVLAIFYGPNNLDINDFFRKFNRFLLSDKCYLGNNDDQLIYRDHLDNMDDEDLEKLIAKYIEFFFATSWMKSLS